MTTTAQLVWSLGIAIVAVVAGSGLALLLIPQLSLEATIRGGTIALLSITATRLVMWYLSRRQAH